LRDKFDNEETIRVLPVGTGRANPHLVVRTMSEVPLVRSGTAIDGEPAGHSLSGGLTTDDALFDFGFE
jgi:hypothetical protein